MTVTFRLKQPELGFCLRDDAEIVHATSLSPMNGWTRIAIAVKRFIHRTLMASAMTRLGKVLLHRSPVTASLWRTLQDPEEIPATGPKTRAHSERYPIHYEKCKHPHEAQYRYGNNRGKYRECLECGSRKQVTSTWTNPYNGETIEILEEAPRRLKPGGGLASSRKSSTSSSRSARPSQPAPAAKSSTTPNIRPSRRPTSVRFGEAEEIPVHHRLDQEDEKTDSECEEEMEMETPVM